MRKKTSELVSLLRSSLEKNDLRTSDLETIALSNGFKSGYVRKVCGDHFHLIGRGLWSINKNTQYTPVRLLGSHIRRIAQAVLIDGSAIRLNNSIVRKIAIAEGFKDLPRNLSTVIRKEFKRSYQEMMELALSPTPEVIPEPQPQPQLDLLSELKKFIGEEARKVFDELRSDNGKITAGEDTSTTHSPAPTNPPPLKILVTSLLSSQIADFKRRPKVKAQVDNNNLSLFFIAQDRSSFELPTVDHCVIMRKTSHSLWNKMIDEYGRSSVHLVNGVHSLEDKILELLSPRRHAQIGK